MQGTLLEDPVHRADPSGIDFLHPYLDFHEAGTAEEIGEPCIGISVIISRADPRDNSHGGSKFIGRGLWFTAVPC